MELEKAVGLIALGWLIGALLLMGRSIRRGRELAETLARRHPKIYEALGRPRPGYLHSVRRDRFAQFVGRREYENLADADLSLDSRTTEGSKLGSFCLCLRAWRSWLYSS